MTESSRLPGKVFADIGGILMLKRVLERLARAKRLVARTRQRVARLVRRRYSHVSTPRRVIALLEMHLAEEFADYRHIFRRIDTMYRSLMLPLLHETVGVIRSRQQVDKSPTIAN